MPSAQLFPITCQAGIKKDGTQLSGNYYIDGQWLRFQRGLPRKMGGYQQINTYPLVQRGSFVVPNVPNFDVYSGDSTHIHYQKIDQFNNPIGGIVDRTPVGFPVNANYLYQFGQMFLTANNASNIIVHPGENLNTIDSLVDTPVFFGDISTLAPLTQSAINISGGFTVMHPFIVYFGNFGNVIIADGTTLPPAGGIGVPIFDARVCAQKIVAGLPLRGTSSGPACLLWGLDAVIRVVATGNASLFAFYTVTSENSILSSRSVIEYDGIFYWAGIDRFLFYNGTVQELPNQMNLDFFFQNLNYAQRQKVWCTKIPQWGEIWWHYPSGNAVECNAAVIYNKRENSWYSTNYPASANYPGNAQGRGTGYFEQVFADPIWMDNLANNAGTFASWVHETGEDENVNGILSAIPSFFTTGDLSWVATGPTGSWTGVDRWIDLERIEPDFWEQVGNISVTVTSYEYAGDVVTNTPIPPSGFGPYILAPGQEKADMREQGRYMFLTFTSNSIGGFYELGQLLLWFRIGDARP